MGSKTTKKCIPLLTEEKNLHPSREQISQKAMEALKEISRRTDKTRSDIARYRSASRSATSSFHLRTKS